MRLVFPYVTLRHPSLCPASSNHLISLVSFSPCRPPTDNLALSPQSFPFITQIRCRARVFCSWQREACEDGKKKRKEPELCQGELYGKFNQTSSVREINGCHYSYLTEGGASVVDASVWMCLRGWGSRSCCLYRDKVFSDNQTLWKVCVCGGGISAGWREEGQLLTLHRRILPRSYRFQFT